MKTSNVLLLALIASGCVEHPDNTWQAMRACQKALSKSLTQASEPLTVLPGEAVAYGALIAVRATPGYIPSAADPDPNAGKPRVLIEYRVGQTANVAVLPCDSLEDAKSRAAAIIEAWKLEAKERRTHP